MSIIIELEGDNYNTKAWYQPGNLGYTLNKAIDHDEACSNIFKCAHKQDPPNHSRNTHQNFNEKTGHDNNWTLPTIIQFKQEIFKAPNKKGILKK